jgi:hypothetical protein
VVHFGKAQVRKRLRNAGPVADVAAVPEATSASYLKRFCCGPEEPLPPNPHPTAR